jgi:hypothetical protein
MLPGDRPISDFGREHGNRYMTPDGSRGVPAGNPPNALVTAK